MRAVDVVDSTRGKDFATILKDRRAVDEVQEVSTDLSHVAQDQYRRRPPATDCTTSFTSCTNPAHSPKPESLAPSRTLTDSIPPSPPIYPPNESLAWPLFSSTTHILGPPPRFAERILPTPPSPPFPSNLFLSYFRAKVRNRVLPLY